MIPKSETPLERIERDIAWLKSLPDIMLSVVRPRGIAHLGPWSDLDDREKDMLLHKLDWKGVDAADYRRITQREVKEYGVFDPPARAWRITPIR